MDEARGEQRPPPAPGSAGTRRSPLRPGKRDVVPEERPPSRLFEELFCSGQTSAALAPLAGALAASSGPQGDVVRKGYLGKLERNHRRYFVLRAGSHTGPSRLEWYKSQEAFAAADRVIYLRCCLGVSRVGSDRRGHTVALYATDQTVVLVAEDRWEQEEWYLAVKKLMEEEREEEEEEEDDDGYCTLPPAAFFKEVWPVTVKPGGLGCSGSLAGESRLCLAASSLVLIRVGACGDLPSVAIPLLSVRRFGHLDGSFFLELGRSAPSGPGEIWMEASDQGNPAVAQRIHEVVREAVRALRALPDFSRSPTSYSQSHALLASKRCRPKHRDKLLSARPHGPRQTPPPRNPESLTRFCPESCRRDRTALESPVRSALHLSPSSSSSSSNQGSETGSYVEMKTEQRLKGMEGWEPGEEEEEEEEGPSYVMMSPQVNHSPSEAPQDDYVTMASPRKHGAPACSPLQTPSDSSASPWQLEHHRTSECSPPRWLLTSVRRSDAGRSAAPQEEEEEASEQRGVPGRTGTASSPASTRSVWSGPGSSGPAQASPGCGTGRAVSERPVRRHQLCLCLPSCLQAEDTS